MEVQRLHGAVVEIFRQGEGQRVLAGGQITDKAGDILTLVQFTVGVPVANVGERFVVQLDAGGTDLSGTQNKEGEAPGVGTAFLDSEGKGEVALAVAFQIKIRLVVNRAGVAEPGIGCSLPILLG